MASEAPVLILDSDEEHLAWMARIVRTVTPHARQADHLDGAGAGVDLIVANYDGIDDADKAKLFAAARPGAAGPRVLLVSSPSRDHKALFEELQQHGLTNLLAADGEVPARDFIVTVQKLLRRDIFGLDKYFGWGVQQFATTVAGSTGTAAAVDLATDFAADLGVNPRLVSNVATVVDELITNALYNAPVDAAGQRRYAHLARTTPVTMEAGREIVVTFCCDGETLGVSVRDGYGTLAKEQCLDYLVKCLRREADPPPGDKGGAGLGLFMTFDALNHLVLNIEPGARTEVVGLIDIRGNYKNFVNRGKSFNMFLQ
jgi:hypothetical protein